MVDLEKLGLTQEQYDALSQEEKDKLSTHPESDEKEKQIKGILADLQKERAKNRELGDTLEDLKGKYEEVVSMLDELKSSGSTPEDLGLTEEDIPNLKQLKQILKKEIENYGEQYVAPLMTSISAMESKFIALSEKETKEKYSSDKVGADLSYDKVIEEGLTPLLKTNPGYKTVIRNSANPAEEAYRIGLLHPKFQEMVTKKKQQEFLDKLTQGKIKTGVGSGGPTGGGVSAETPIQDLLKLSDEELDRLARKGG